MDMGGSMNALGPWWMWWCSREGQFGRLPTPRGGEKVGDESLSPATERVATRPSNPDLDGPTPSAAPTSRSRGVGSRTIKPRTLRKLTKAMHNLQNKSMKLDDRASE